MTIYNLGSINADLFYRLPHFPGPGETLAATDHWRGLGGKGTNMSVAAARAAAHVVHIGAVGSDGKWAVERLTEYGVDTTRIATVPDPTGHAIVMLDAAGENSIVLAPGANHAIPADLLSQAMAAATESDTFLFQNETNAQRDGARIASAKGMRVAYAAAPFDSDAVSAVLPLLDLLILNEVEAAQLAKATGQNVETLPVRDIVVTLGAKGARWINTDTGQALDVPALPVTPVDTTGAGDTFTGYLVAGLDRGMPMEQALSLATTAAALMVTRQGTADVIPDLKEVHEMRGG
ncbi:PfkB family carbohydrate kinase [Mesobacterium sp. TK19101]|uniref:Ribokinase n=1 Tax=Mesobacterium hydrothermale TaxID=3111907 RepID=A0ABU6HDW7_9RHOB|nr:PfkB family carbohydrate kinase [Mesobacterium sp. TK19101]MEC3860657.1 PfkB family carbohydrate kinase [Mesobacterium sp. TK19101]